ncbi:hypothetical protein ACFYWX_33720 [Streptomyces sp. NPDC002888]|uniref:hypothetical protein n=1 Tax=Streptomyces sp. NPDC002888 TaxID=3364668 RepID=UPI0036B17E7F
MISEFRSSLEGLARTIEAHPSLDLLAFELQAPAPAALINDVEARLGSSLPTPLRQLYGLLNGASLSWRFKPDLDSQNRSLLMEECADSATRNSLFGKAGGIEVLPIEDMLFDEEYSLPQSEPDEGEFDFDGTVYSSNTFCGMLRPFDAVSDFFAMAFVVQPGKQDWKMMLLGDYWIEYDYSRVTYLDDYLSFTIATWGLVGARVGIFSDYRGDRKEPLRYNPELAKTHLPSILAG